MECPKCGYRQGDIYIPIDQGKLTDEAYFCCDNCGYDEVISDRDLMELFFESRIKKDGDDTR